MEPSSSSVMSRIYSSDWLSPTRLSDSPVPYDFPGDRFIPNRSLMDLDHAISLLTNNTPEKKKEKTLSPENPTFNEEYRRKINEVINSVSDGKQFIMLVFRGRKRSERPRIRLIDEILDQDETDEKKNMNSLRRLPKDETDEKKNVKSPSRLPKVRSLTPAQEGESPSHSLSSPLLPHSGDGSPVAAEYYSCSSSFNDLAQLSGDNSSDPPRVPLDGPPRQEVGLQAISDEITIIALSITLSFGIYAYLPQGRPEQQNSSMLYKFGSLMCCLISLLVLSMLWVCKAAHPRAKHMARCLVLFSMFCQFHLFLGYFSFFEVDYIGLILKVAILASPTLIGVLMFLMFYYFV